MKFISNGQVVELYGGNSSASEVYSTEERWIGYWTDGKPLYRKLISTTMPSKKNAWVQLVLKESGITVVMLQAYAWDTGRNYVEQLPTNAGSGAAIQPSKVVYNNSLTAVDGIPSGLSAYTGDYYMSCPIDVVIEYTKTTDTPSALLPGANTPSLEIYDGEERVIGTWFGKPLYQKVLTGTTPTANNQEADYGAVSDDLEAVIKLQCVALLPNGYWTDLTYGFQSNGFATAQVRDSDKNLTIYVTNAVFHDAPFRAVIQYTKTTDSEPSISTLEYFDEDTAADVIASESAPNFIPTTGVDPSK